MTTIEEFKNAPVGSIARRPGCPVAVKITDLPTSKGNWDDGLVKMTVEMLVDYDYALDPAHPSTAREALDLAWELAHPIKAGDVIPAGTRCIQWHKGTNNWHIYDEVGDFETDAYALGTIRTLDPLPDPLPDWLDAPAVIARVAPHLFRQAAVFTPTSDNPGRWTRAESTWTVHWSALTDVTPLWPREETDR